MTSWRKRIGLVCNTINSLFNQSFPPDRIVLNLSKDEFPSGYAELPENLISLINRGLEIEWVQANSKSFKKLIPTLDRYRDAIVMTADDDLIYPYNFVQNIANNYNDRPLSLNLGRTWMSGYASVYEYRFFGKYLHAFDRWEVWRTNEDDIAYGVLMMLNGFSCDFCHDPYWQYMHQVDEGNGLGRTGAYNSKRNAIWFNGYISRRYGVDYNWLRNNISQHNSFELNDKEPYSDDTAIQTYIDIQFNPVEEKPVPVPVEVPVIIVEPPKPQPEPKPKPKPKPQEFKDGKKVISKNTIIVINNSSKKLRKIITKGA